MIGAQPHTAWLPPSVERDPSGFVVTGTDLSDDAFRAFAQDGLKTFRKRNAFMVFGTQSPADALRSPIAHSIIEQTATFTTIMF